VLEHRPQIRAWRVDRGARDVREVRTIRIDDVVLPVRLEDLAMCGELALVGGEAIGAIENSEKIW
jgi:hypothetical protein